MAEYPVNIHLPFENPFRPGAGHTPPYLAGRRGEMDEFRKMLTQTVILENLVLTGLRGVGKTALLGRLKPMALEAGWLWVGTDLSESASVSETSLVTRLLTDLATFTSSLVIGSELQMEIGFGTESASVERTLEFKTLHALYRETPGLESDRLKRVLEVVWSLLQPHGRPGMIFAYDEAQNLTDHAEKEQFPLSVLLEVFQSIQRKGIPFMLALAGLPTLVANLVEARTCAERMFHVMFLQGLSREESRKAIVEPTKSGSIRFQADSVETIADLSGGYPYFIQFICREFFDLLAQRLERDRSPEVPVFEITQKLDIDFFAGRWQRATDRQRDLLYAAAHLETAGSEFTVQELVQKTKEVLRAPFASSHVNQMLKALCEKSLIFKHRHGRYSFAVPLFDQFILRQEPPVGALAESASD